MSGAVVLGPGLWWVATSASNAYLWRGRSGKVIVIDPGLPGDESIMVSALGEIGSSPREVELVLVTHHHADHAGAASSLAALTAARVAAGVADAAVLRGVSLPPQPALSAKEKPIYDMITSGGADSPPRCAIDVELTGGEAIDDEGLLVVKAVPGHTWGSVAVHLPHLGAVITGDVAVEAPTGGVSVGPFNADRAMARAAVQTLGGLHPVIVGLGHGTPVLQDAGRALLDATDAWAD
ncbi:MAG: MBL fold metallo-hydrolase [Propionibacteriaceae bacterium]